MATHPRERAARPGDPARAQEERDPETERVEPEQPRAPRDGSARARDGEDRGEDRSDAGRPAECEGHSEGKGAARTLRYPCEVEATLAGEEGKAEQAGHRQAEDDDHPAGNAQDEREVPDEERQTGQINSALARTRQQLNSAVVSDAQVQSAVTRLSSIVATDQSALARAQATLALAQRNVVVEKKQAAAVAAELAKTRTIARQAAIELYVSGSSAQSIGDFLTSDLSRAPLVQTYGKAASSILASKFSSFEIAQLSAMRTTKHLEAAREQATTQLATVSTVAKSAQEALSVQSEAHVVLQARITAFRAESAHLAAEQHQIEVLIAQREAAAAAQRQAAQAAAAAGGNSGTPPPAASSAAGLVWPLQGIVTSPFGPRWGGFHPGIDISDPTGTPIHSAGSGTVLFSGWYGGYGNFVLIDNGGGIVTGYAHQSQIAVSQGEAVRQGQVIGYVGSTGDSTGPHLHFEVRVNGTAENPTSYVSGSP